MAPFLEQLDLDEEEKEEKIDKYKDLQSDIVSGEELRQNDYLHILNKVAKHLATNEFIHHNWSLHTVPKINGHLITSGNPVCLVESINSNFPRKFNYIPLTDHLALFGSNQKIPTPKELPKQRVAFLNSMMIENAQTFFYSRNNDFRFMPEKGKYIMFDTQWELLPDSQFNF